ncbi:Beta-1,3-glucosyltransferase [Escherichia coli ISC41]|nr:Beta-1,3-glucosyltransferase [Escherichia coli ISC41]
MKNGIDVSVIIPAYNAAETSVSWLLKSSVNPTWLLNLSLSMTVLLMKLATFFVKSTMIGSFSLSRPIKVSMPPEMLL